jgi:hypothetical protein
VMNANTIISAFFVLEIIAMIVLIVWLIAMLIEDRRRRKALERNPFKLCRIRSP